MLHQMEPSIYRYEDSKLVDNTQYICELRVWDWNYGRQPSSKDSTGAGENTWPIEIVHSRNVELRHRE